VERTLGPLPSHGEATVIDALSVEEIASAISGHQFRDAYPHLAADVSWTQVGEHRLDGRDAFIAACEATATYLQGVSTAFRQFRVLAARDFVVINSIAEYAGADGSMSVVASCDLYEFTAGTLSNLTSYNIELPDIPVEASIR
jgi:hypothetical protein